MVRVASPVFVGRAAELAALDEAFELAAQGGTRTVLIGGDAGVGKTRLLSTWNERAQQHGARVVTGACLDLGEGGPAYVAVVQAFRELLGSIEPLAIDDLVGTDRPTLARVIPELLDEVEAQEGGPRSRLMAQTRLFDRLVGLLERASSTTPLAFELEDIHWADPSTRAFLQYLVANSSARGLLVVATFRTEEAGRDHPLASVLRQLDHDPGVTRVDVRPFDEEELREQLHGILGQVPTDRLLAAVNARSEGNALFAEELVASQQKPELPTSIGASLLFRTEGLSRDTRLTLRVASVAGRTASYGVLRLATTLPDDRLGDALREAVGANILEPEHVGERYRFRHALLQEAIYQDALPGERRQLHTGVAAALEAESGGRPDDPVLAPQLAYHWFEAKDYDRAFAASLAAARVAVGQAAYAEGLQHYERVLGLWDDVPRAHKGLSHAEILVEASHIAAYAGESGRTVVLGQRALEEVGEDGDTILRVHALDEVARALHGMARDSESNEYELRLDRIQPDGLPVLEHMIVLDSRQRLCIWNGDLTGATAAAVEAVRFADTTDDLEVKGDAHIVLAWVLYGVRDVEGAIAEAVLGREFASTAGDSETELEALTVISDSYAESAEHEKCIETAREARAFADRAGLSRWGGPVMSVAEAEALLRLGRINESAEVIDAALRDRTADRPFLLLDLLAAQVSIVRGTFEDAANHIEASRIPGATLDEENDRSWLATVRAELARAEGRLDDVRRIVETTAPRVADLPTFTDMSEGIWPLAVIWLDATATQVEAARAAGDAAATEAAAAGADTLVGYVERVRKQRDADGVRDTGRHRGDEALIAGHLARIEGRDDPALWVAAAELFPSASVEALSARYRQAEAMLATRRPRDEIASIMAAARATAVEIGARPLAARFEGLARRARIDLRVAKHTDAAADEAGVRQDEPLPPGTEALRKRGLTDREIEVLTLVAGGYPNAEIAERLFISSKTASVHVSHIMDKLGASSRTEAATIGVRLGLPEIDEH